MTLIKIQKVSKRPLGNQLGQTSTYLLILEGRPMANKQNKLRIISEVSLICGFLITCKSRVVLSDLWVGGRQIPCQSVILLYIGWDVCNKMEKRGNVPSHKGASPESVNISNTQNNSHIWFKIIWILVDNNWTCVTVVFFYSFSIGRLSYLEKSKALFNHEFEKKVFGIPLICHFYYTGKIFGE